MYELQTDVTFVTEEVLQLEKHLMTPFDRQIWK